jgi:hypothetical protein
VGDNRVSAAIPSKRSPCLTPSRDTMDTSHAQVRLDHDARAIAISAIALVEGLIFLLTEKGVIDPSHPVEFFDEVLNALKQY